MRHWTGQRSAQISGTISFARALFEDLSDVLEITNPLGVGSASALTYPARDVRRETLILRNI